jgi:hypothetical protein
MAFRNMKRNRRKYILGLNRGMNNSRKYVFWDMKNTV